MKHILLILYLFLTCWLTAQNFHFLDIPVYKNGQQMANPWAGGLNAPQWASFDLNRDGVKDLYAFDRNGDVHLAFINKNNAVGATEYKHERHWVKKFPANKHFVLMRDYNRDGRPDLFSSSIDETGYSGLLAYKASYGTDNLLEFEQLEFPGFGNSIPIKPIEINGIDYKIIEIFNVPDYPCIDDIDGDGDLDIVAMNGAGNKAFWYKNTALESGFNDEVLQYELVDDCWGRFGLIPFSAEITLSDNNAECPFFRGNEFEYDRVHGGATITTLDVDNDGDKEMLYGDLIFPNIIFAKNGGNKDQAWFIEQDATFPSYDISVDIPEFPASYHVDVNNDGARDLLFCPNQEEDTPDVETVRLYENTGTDELPIFQFKQSDFLVDGILDFGTGTSPVLEDVNADGLLDIVLSNGIEWDTSSGAIGHSFLVLMLNVGTETEPAFEITDDNWLDIKQYNWIEQGIRKPAPAFGDLDNDGDRDLLIGDSEGRLHFYENIAGVDMPMEFAAPQFIWKNIIVGRESTPFIFDVNKDGRLDLIIGERAGNINYFPNIGTPETPEFEPDEALLPNNEFFGNIITTTGGSPIGLSQPFVAEFAGEINIILGTNEGWLQRYLVDPDSLEAGAFELLDARFGNLREGKNSRVFFANLNNNDYLEAIIGNGRGGLAIFQSPFAADGTVDVKNNLTEQTKISIYPNPTNGVIYLKGQTGSFDFWVYNSMGQLVNTGKNSTENDINLSGMAEGLYFVKIKSGNLMFTERVYKN